MRLLSPRIADQNIQSAEAFDSPAHQLLAEVLVPNVARQCEPLALLRSDQFDDLLGIGFFRGKIVDGNVGSFPRKCNRRRPSHP